MQDDLEYLAISTYKNNLIYFEKSQKNIYNKLASFDQAIEQNHYQNRYDLIVKDNYFDVQELSSGNYLYSTDSNEYAKLAAKSINFKKESNVYETFRKIKIDEKDLDEYAKIDIKENNLSGLASILSYLQKNKAPDSDLNYIKKFIFFGVGLGQHIIEIDKKINADIYLIVEDDLELFKLSLFTTPYYELASKSKLIFSVFDTKDEFSKPALKFLEDEFYYNHYIKYFPMLNHSEEKLEEFHLKIASQSHNLFFYDAILQQYLRPMEYMRDNFKFLNILQSYSDSPLGSKPVLLLAAGPSLEKNIEWIRVNQDKFIIIALSATLRLLEKNSVLPSIVTHIDGFDDAIPHFEKLNSIDFFKNSIFLMSARTPQGVMSYLNKKNVFLFENGTSYKKALGNLSAPCIGSTTYLLFLAFGVKELYLLGLDLALDSSTGSTHADGHYQGKTLDLSESEVHKDTITFKDHLIKVPGNLQENVYTLPDWKLSIESVNSSSIGFKKVNQHVYNLSDGAAFANTLSQDINGVDLTSFESINKEIICGELSENFTNHSSSSLSNNELLLLQQRLNYAVELKSIILDQQNKYFGSDKDFLDSLVILFKNCASNTSDIAYDLSLVYQEYFKLIYTFVFDFFNSGELTDEELHANNINKLLSVQLLRIIDAYINEFDFVK